MNIIPLILVLLGTLAIQPLTAFAEEKPTTAAVTPTPTPNPDPYANETKEQRDARMAWWRDARFGMFIHWGVYAVPAGFHKGQPVGGLGEWIMHGGKIPAEEYKPYAQQFNPTQYDPEAWVLLAKKAGMKYIVITTKHHDGFALWPSAASDWNIEATPYKKDLLKPLVEACQKHGMKLGFYYSQAKDWINDGASTPNPNPSRTMDEYIDEIAVPQVRELLTNYGDAPVILWWDFPTKMNEERAAKLIDLLKLKPGIIHNNRLLKNTPYGKVDMEKIKSGKRDPYSGDTETPEQHIPDTGLGDRDWESCMTINDTWGFKSNDNNWKSSKTLIQQLIDIASKGGNYLLNVGPTAEGIIPEPSVERLQDIGKWMEVNSESIYGTQASPFPKLNWGRCTQKKHDNGTTLYLHVFEWPNNGELLVPGLENEVKSAVLLANGEAVEFEKTPEGVELELPEKALDPNATVIKVEIAGEPKVTAPQAQEPGKTAKAGEVWDILQQQEGGPPAVSPLPTDVQLKYHHLEKQLFIHFTVNTFTGNEWGSGKEDPNIFAPTAKDFCKQWVQIAKENGFKAISLTTKHHDGFCLWPSRYTDHSVKSSKWRDGVGDVVREFADACNKEGIAINYYLSPWDRHDKRYGTEAYNEYFTNQLVELMTEYGPVTGFWFDGAFEGSRDTNNLSPFDWPGFYKVIRRYAPGAYIQMMGPDIGWVGNEAGVSPEENWNLETAPYAAKSNARRGKPPVAYIGHTYDKKADAEVVAGGQPNYKAVEVLRYMPREANTSILRGWFWKRGDGEEPKSPQQLRDIYFTSIGRGSTMMLNLAPDQTGLIPEKQVAALKQLTEEIKTIFAVNLAEGAKIEADKTWGGGDARFSAEKALDGQQTTYWAGKDQDVTGTLTLDLGKKKSVNVFELREPIQMGQRVGAYRMEYLDEAGKWSTLHAGKTIGYRSQIRFPAVTAQKFRLVIEDGRTTPLISAIGLYWNPYDDRKNPNDYKPGETETGTREEGAI